MKFIRRVFIYGVCLFAVALVSVVATCEVMGVERISGAPTYSINDLQNVEDALHNYYLEVFTEGKPIYPAMLQDLVAKKYITQDHLDELMGTYEIEYYHPPKPNISGDPILFRAVHRMPIITYSVGGHMRMKDPEALSNKATKPDVTVDSDLP